MGDAHSQIIIMKKAEANLHLLKGLSHEIDLKKIDKYGKIWA
jgi:hypothetical protein